MLHKLESCCRPAQAPDLRIYLAFFLLAQGLARSIYSTSLAEINLFPARMYGVLQAITGLALLLTVRQRARWPGRIVAILAVWLELLLLFDVWGLWVTCASLCVQILALANEARR